MSGPSSSNSRPSVIVVNPEARRGGVMRAKLLKDRVSHGFRTRFIRYRLSFENWQRLNLKQMEKAMGKDFENLLKDNLLGGRVAVPFVDMDRIGADHMADVLSRAIESNKQMGFDNQIELDVTLHPTQQQHRSSVIQLRGNGRRRKVAIPNEQRFLQQIRGVLDPSLNGDGDAGLCLGASLHLALVMVTRGGREAHSVRNRPNFLRAKVREYYEAAGIAQGPLGLGDIDLLGGIDAFQNFSISVFDARGVRVYFHDKGPQSRDLCLAFGGGGRLGDAGHYYALAKPAKLMGSRKVWCRTCGLGFRRATHNCLKARCCVCKNPTCPNDGNRRERKRTCAICHMFYFTDACMGAHRCGDKIKCLVCDQVGQRGQFDEDGVHKNCGMKYCSVCQKLVNKNTHDWCFVNKYKCKLEDMVGERRARALAEWDDEDEDRPPDQAETFVYDIETTRSPEDGVLSDFLTVMVTPDEQVHAFWTDDASTSCTKLLEYILANENMGKKKTILLAHNSARFDSYFVLKAAVVMDLETSLIAVEQRLIEIRLKAKCVIFRDTFLFAPLSLRLLTPAFGFDDAEGKSWFPMDRLEPQWCNSVFPFPELGEFGSERMGADELARLTAWRHDEIARTQGMFDFNEQLYTYCVQDCIALRRSIDRFCQIFGEYVGLNPVAVSSTAPSFLNRLWRSDYLESDDILVNEPQIGIDAQHGVSRLCSTFLGWIEENEPALQLMREQRFGRYTVDGYSRVSEPLTFPGLEQVPVGALLAVEILGCLWHGCEHCMGENAENPVTKRLNKDMLADTQERETKLRETYRLWVVNFQECKIMEAMETDEPMRLFFLDAKTVPPLRPRDAFYGAQTTVFRRYCEATDEYEIWYLDICSLYPYVNSTAEYPLGKPEIRRDVEPAEIELDKLGLHQVTIEAPTNEYYPILPIRTKTGRLVFALCFSCATKQSQDECTCTREQRWITQVYTSIELKKALEMNYVLISVHISWVYPRSTRTLFAPLIHKFFAIKCASSGFPPQVTSDAEKTEYRDRVNGLLGSDLQIGDFVKRPGLRFVSKVSINSVWGKFGTRPFTTKTVICRRGEDVNELFAARNVQVHALSELTDSAMLVMYQEIKETAKSLPNTSVAVAAFTTAAARLELQKGLEAIPPCDILYCDTDSIIFRRRRNTGPPPSLKMGDWMGDWTPEACSQRITKFGAAGPKSYVIEWRDENGELHDEIKCKGITLHSGNREQLTTDAILQLIIDGQDENRIVVDDPNLMRKDMKNLRISIKNAATKSFRVTAGQKRYILPGNAGDNERDIDSVPFGFRNA